MRCGRECVDDMLCAAYEVLERHGIIEIVRAGTDTGGEP
jgi:hypothetical protein